jgi:hypothetical protein
MPVGRSGCTASELQLKWRGKKRPPEPVVPESGVFGVYFGAFARDARLPRTPTMIDHVVQGIKAKQAHALA